jgi:hypothetical protein
MKHAEDLVYIYTNNKLFWEWFGANPIAWYTKNMLFKDHICPMLVSIWMEASH